MSNERNISLYKAIGREGYNNFISSLSDGKPIQARQKKVWTTNLSLYGIYSYISQDRATSYEESFTDVTKEIRETKDKNEYKYKKCHLLDFVCFAGVPVKTEEERKDGGTITKCRCKENFNLKGAIFSNLVTIDIDHISEYGIDIKTLREAIYQNKESGVCLLFVSPSGDGLKIICKSKKGYDSDQTYKEEYNTLKNYFNNWLKNTFNTGLQVDNSGSDISRTCYLCYDSEAIYCELEGNLFDSNKYPVPKEEKPKVFQVNYGSNSKENDWNYILWLVEQIESKGVDIAPTYQEYLPLVSTFKYIGTKYGYGLELLQRVCSYYSDYDELQVTTDYDNLKESNNIGTLVELCKANRINTAKKDLLKSIKNSLKKEESKKMNNNTIKENNEVKTAITGEIEGNTESQEEVYVSPFRQNLEKLEAGYYLDRIGNIPEGLGTGLLIGYVDDNGSLSNEVELKLPANGITFIGALSGHGKTTLLRNLILKLAKNEEEGDILFFAFEEGEDKTIHNLIALQIGEKLDNRGKTNYEVIEEYCRKRKKGALERKNEKIEKAESKIISLRKSGKLLIYDKNECSETLADMIFKEAKNHKIKAVFIDYIQKMESSSKVGGERRDEELSRVCKSLQNLVERKEQFQDLGYCLPIIASAQLSNTAITPDLLGNTNMAGAYAISQYADYNIVIANSKKKANFKGVTEKGKGKNKWEEFFETPNLMYLRVCKGRGTIDEREAWLEVVPETGEVKNQ